MKPLDSVANGIACLQIATRCFTYKGRGLKGSAILHWLSLFETKHRCIARRFLRRIVFIKTRAIERTLAREGTKTMSIIIGQRVRPDEVLVVQIDEIASSAASAVAFFRKNVHGGKKCEYVIASDHLRLMALAMSGTIRAVVYIDDFIGSGDQIKAARDKVISSLGYPVAEYVIAAVILEEANDILQRECTVEYAYKHDKSERPMLAGAHGFSDYDRSVLISMSRKLCAEHELGYGQCASMIVLGNDVPDNAPPLIRRTLFECD